MSHLNTAYKLGADAAILAFEKDANLLGNLAAKAKQGFGALTRTAKPGAAAAVGGGGMPSMAGFKSVAGRGPLPAGMGQATGIGMPSLANFQSLVR